jgi:recyclin-1
MDKLPTEVLLRLLTFLPLPDLPIVASTCHRFARLINSDYVWNPKLTQLGIVEQDFNGEAIVKVDWSLAPLDTLVVLQERNQLGDDLHVDRNVTSWRRSPSHRSTPPSIVPAHSPNHSTRPSIEQQRSSTESTERPSFERRPRERPSLEQKHTEQQVDLLGMSHLTHFVQPALMDFYKSGKQIIHTDAFIAQQDEKLAPQTWKKSQFKRQFLLLKQLLRDFDQDALTSDKNLKVLTCKPKADEVAMVFRRLQRFAVGGYTYHTDRHLKPLAKTAERLETSFLSKFEEAYNQKDLKKMTEYANAGLHLNGGGAMVQMFIAKNPLLYDETYNPSLRASRLSEMSSSDSENQFALSETFQKFMQQWLENIKEQASIIAEVFPPETNALSHFVEAIFQASVQDYISSVLAEANKRDKVTYLNTLATAVNTCHEFLAFLGGMDGDEGKHDFDAVLSLIADTFQPYFGTYISEELESLEHIYTTELGRWDLEKARRKRGKGGQMLDSTNKQTVLTTMKNILLAPTYLTRSLFSKEKKEEDGYTSAVDLSQLHLDDKNLAYLVSLELCLNLIHQNKEAVRRDAMIAGALNHSRLKPDVQAIYVVLLKAIGRHIHSGFREAIATLAATKPFDDGDSLVVGSLVQFFELVHIADLIHQMLHVYYVEDIKQFVDENDFRSAVISEKKLLESSLDDLVAHGMDSAIRVLIDHLEWVLLSEQKPGDFDPSQQVDLSPTNACVKVVACLNAHTSMIQGATDKHIMDVFCQEIGVRFYHSVCKNLRRSRISPTGGLRVIADLNEYYKWATSLRNPEVNKMFSLLKELGNIYIVEKPGDLRDMIHDPSRYHGLIRIEEIYELLQGRTDWRRIQKTVETNECVVQ